MNYRNDTIAAVSTPLGSGGISVIRISGEKAFEVVAAVFQGKTNLKKAISHTAHFGKIVYKNQVIDEVLITIFRKPNSYTGEDVAEISCHGSLFITGKILEILLEKVRLAEPGEFTQRAFLNNKIGLTQAEAVGDLIDAKTRISHLAAIEQLEGSLKHRIENLLHNLTKYRTLLELEIDFLEQDIPEIDIPELSINIEKLKTDLEQLARTGEEGLILKEGLKICLVGAPNVGKSSIFNAFLETERAIVTPIPGTTRDYLEEAISLGGYLVRIFDTAGMRDSEDEIEKIGIRRSYEIIAAADKVLFIIDGKEREDEFSKLAEIVNPAKILKVLNKADLFAEDEIAKFKQKDYIICSAVRENGLRELKEKLIGDISISEEELESGILTNARQIAAVKRAIKSLEHALNSLNDNMGFEFTAFDLKEASSALEEIVGIVTTDDILNDIFSNFCIGK